MNNYNLILDCIDDINDSVVTTESNVITSLMNSYYKQYELFTECEYLGKDPYKIYQEASIMDEVKERSSKDKNKLITFLKFVPRLIITIIKKIKNKLFGKKDKSNSVTSTDNSSGKESINANNSSNLFNKETIEKTRKAVSKSKTGKIVLGGGVTVVALATGGLLISKAINKKGKKKNNGKSKDVKLEITKDNKIKCNFNIKNIKGLSEKLVRLFKRNTNKINDGKTLTKQEVDQFEECVDDLKKELDNKNDNTDSVVDNSDLIINDEVVKVLEDNSMDKAIEIMSKYINGSDGETNNILIDQTMDRFINSLPEAISLLDNSVDIFIETCEMFKSQMHIQFNDNDSSRQKSGDGKKKNATSDDHEDAAMIKDNCEKLTKFYDNALKRLKDIEDVLSKFPDTDSGKLRQHFEQMLKKLSRENEKFNTKESLLMLDGTFNMLNDVLGEPIRDSYLDAISREKANKPLPENIYKLLAYLKNIGCVDVYMDDVMEIERVGQLIYLDGPRIPTNIKRQEDCAEINMLPMKLDLEKIGLSHLYTPEHSLDLKLIVKGLGSRFEFSDGDDKKQSKGENPSGPGKRKISGIKQPSPSKSNKIVNNEAVVDGIKSMAKYINGISDYEVGEELINVGDDKLKVPVIEQPESSPLFMWLPKSSINSIIDAFNKVIKNVILNESKAIDFDKEVLEPINSVIDKYIHKSIKETDYHSKHIKNYLMHFGYVPLSVNVGDDYNQDIAKYFERSVPEATDDESKKGKIAKIELTPFKWDNDAIPGIEQYFGQRAKSEHILKGVCHYYKK